MLHVQEEQGDHRSLTPTLPSSPSCGIWCVHWVMLSSVVELIACWSGKSFRIKTKVLGECFFIVLCGSFGGKGIHAPLKE